MKTIKIRLDRSLIGTLNKHRRIVKSLGLRKVHHTREVKDCPEIRGQLKKVEYLVSIVD